MYPHAHSLIPGLCSSKSASLSLSMEGDEVRPFPPTLFVSFFLGSSLRRGEGEFGFLVMSESDTEGMVIQHVVVEGHHILLRKKLYLRHVGRC